VAGGFKVTRDSVAGRQAVIARAARFRPGRLGARLHVFVLVAVFKAGMAGRDNLDRFLDEAGQYAATVKGGAASGATAVAVAVTEPAGGPVPGDLVPENWAVAPLGRVQPGRSPAFPVLVDLYAGRITCPESPPDLRRLVQAHVVPVLGGEG